MIDYDLELRHHNDVLRRSYGIRASDRVLDVGCGTGQTTREAARLATAGAVLGIDRSDAMIERARALARAAGLRNLDHECADVERHALPRERFDVAISRFGTMFFDHPVAAFSNIHSALRPDGGLVMMVWQQHDCNEWATSIERALAPDEAGNAPSPAARQPFSLGDPGRRTVKSPFRRLRRPDVRRGACIRLLRLRCRCRVRIRLSICDRARDGGTPRRPPARARARLPPPRGGRARAGRWRMVRLTRLDRGCAPELRVCPRKWEFGVCQNCFRCPRCQASVFAGNSPQRSVVGKGPITPAAVAGRAWIACERNARPTNRNEAPAMRHNRPAIKKATR